MPGAAATAASAAATVGSSLLGSHAAGKASKAAAAANAANQQFLHGVYDTAQGNLNPTIQNGAQAGNALAGLLGIGGDPNASRQAFDQFRNSTNYNFLFDQGTQAVKTANAPSFNSGATAKALLNYGQGMAGNALAGYESMLGGQQQLGAQSALGLGQIGAGVGQTISGSNNANAGAQGSSAVYGANALGSGLGALTGQSSFGGSGGGIGGFLSALGQGTLGIGNNTSSFMPATSGGSAFEGITPTNFGGGNFATLPSL